MKRVLKFFLYNDKSSIITLLNPTKKKNNCKNLLFYENRVRCFEKVIWYKR